eukprot:619785-Rhodomonas_salina.2
MSSLNNGATVLRWGLGLLGCKYNPISDLCFTSVNCNCSKSYFQCMHNGGCVDEESNRAFARMCAADGCTAAQCGIQDALPCNYTAQARSRSHALGDRDHDRDVNGNFDGDIVIVVAMEMEKEMVTKEMAETTQMMIDEATPMMTPP